MNFAQELPPGALALRKLSPGEYPDFAGAMRAFSLRGVPVAIDRSLAYLAVRSSAAFFPYADISHDRAVASLVALKQLIAQEQPNTDDGRHFDAQVKAMFEVYASVGAPDPNGNGYTGNVQFTGYCTPIYSASHTRAGPFQFPLYKRPADLVNLDPNGDHVGRRLPDGTTTDYYTRRQIEQQHVLDGQELIWLSSRLDAYVVTVQGSARLRLPDGTIEEVGYAGNNGRAYVSPGKQMVADGVVPADGLNLRTLRAYFAAHPQAMDKYLSINDRTVFFANRPGGPFGKLNVPVTPYATIATDKSIYPRAMPAFLTVKMPSPGGQFYDFRGFMMDQDAGGAIRAAGRCDVYMGIGDEAEQLSGRELQVGQLYYLALRPELVGRYLGRP